MNIPINVWYYNDLLSEWILKGTTDYQETKDEHKYFRVISSYGKKDFYNSADDYFNHSKNTIVNDYKIQFTDVSGNIIYENT